MKQFTDIRSAANYVFSHANAGNEKTINEVLHFGLGVYAYGVECRKAGIKGKMANNFWRINKTEVKRLLAWLLATDGYLCVM